MDHDVNHRRPAPPPPRAAGAAPVPGRRTLVAPQPQGVTVLRGRQTTTVPPAAAAPTNQQQTAVEYNNLATELIAEFYLLDSRIAGAYLPYKQAYNLHVGALRAHAARTALTCDIMMSILFVGLGGVAGAWVQTLVRGASTALLESVVATGIGDVVKYGTRQVGGEGRRLPDAIVPTGDEPDEWMAAAMRDIRAVQGTVLQQLNAARAAANAHGLDPAQLAAMRAQLDVFRALAPPRQRVEYSLDMWRPWLQHAMTQIQSRMDLGYWRSRHRDIMQAIRDQCGEVPGLTLLIEEICGNAATGAGAYDRPGGRPIGAPLDGCAGMGFTGPGTDPAPAPTPRP